MNNTERTKLNAKTGAVRHLFNMLLIYSFQSLHLGHLRLYSHILT